MINTIYNELQKYKGEKVDIIINEGRSKIRNELRKAVQNILYSLFSIKLLV